MIQRQIQWYRRILVRLGFQSELRTEVDPKSWYEATIRDSFFAVECGSGVCHEKERG
jgi:hypothetical protein